MDSRGPVCRTDVEEAVSCASAMGLVHEAGAVYDRFLRVVRYGVGGGRRQQWGAATLLLVWPRGESKCVRRPTQCVRKRSPAVRVSRGALPDIVFPAIRVAGGERAPLWR